MEETFGKKLEKGELFFVLGHGITVVQHITPFFIAVDIFIPAYDN